jgi:hypothetical protein
MRMLACLSLAAAFVAGFGQQVQKPAASPSDNHAAMVQRGNGVMGFPASKTTHHFRLLSDGGEIEVTANDRDDAATREVIQMHLSHIAGVFSQGNFNAPMLIHDTTPPGVPTMKKLRKQILYQYEPTGAGGRVRIRTQDRQALDAVHAFLLFQIIEHRTGDSGIVAQAE